MAGNSIDSLITFVPHLSIKYVETIQIVGSYSNMLFPNCDHEFCDVDSGRSLSKNTKTLSISFILYCSNNSST